MSERDLPTVDSAEARAGTSPAPIAVEASSARLVGTLATAGSIAGLAIVLVFQWANPRIEEWRARVLAEAVTEVLGGATRYETVFLEDGAFTPSPRGDTARLERVYVGYDPGDAPVGVAVVGGEPGFQDVIRLIFGYDPGSGLLTGMKVLEHKETPGLGDKITRDSAFIAEFDGVATPLVEVKSGREVGAAAEVTMITGATISSRAIVDIINHRLEELQGPIDQYWRTSPALRGGGP